MYDIIYEELSSDEIKKYLERIGFTETPKVSKACLDELIYLHQCHVPFECLDTYHTDVMIPLDKASLYDKIVTRHRGGFCFELNGLFCLLLRGLGFDAYSVMCRVANTTELRNIAPWMAGSIWWTSVLADRWQPLPWSFPRKSSRGMARHTGSRMRRAAGI